MPLQVQNTLVPAQQNILGQGGNLVSQLLGMQGGNNPFMPLSPDATASWWNQSMRPEAENQFNKKVMPQVQESFVGPGTYWGGARAQAESDARQNFENQQSQQIGNYYMQNRTLANQSLLPFALGLLNANTGIAYGQQGQASGGMGGFGELLKQLMQKQLGGQGQQTDQGFTYSGLGAYPLGEQFSGPLGPQENLPIRPTEYSASNPYDPTSVLPYGWGMNSNSSMDQAARYEQEMLGGQRDYSNYDWFAGGLNPNMNAPETQSVFDTYWNNVASGLLGPEFSGNTVPYDEATEF